MIQKQVHRSSRVDELGVWMGGDIKTCESNVDEDAMDEGKYIKMHWEIQRQRQRGFEIK